MNLSLTGHAIPRTRTIIFALVALLTALAVLAPAQGEAKKKKKAVSTKITTMTRNVYLGADLGPAINSTDLDGAIEAAGGIYNEVQRTNFPERAVPLAKEINKAKPDLVGLQEVARWNIQDPSDGGWEESGGLPAPNGTPATETDYDFLQLLLDNLGGTYKVVTAQEEFDAELPADIDSDNSTGTGPLGAGVFGADLDYRLTMRDVILVRKGSKVKAPKKSVKQKHYENAYSATVGGVAEITALRGWQSVDAKYKKGRKFKTNTFRFVNTHLEAFGDPAIREAQAQELYAKGGPLKTGKRVVLVGDFNSGLTSPHNIFGADQLAYKALLDFGMKDAGAIQSCCYPSALDDPGFTFDHTVDHVMTKPKAKPLGAYVTGNDPAEITQSGLWPSDHGGVVSKIKLRR